MKKEPKNAYRALAPLLACAALAPWAASAEVVEEIVAWVEGDIITMSQLQEEEKNLVAELYRRYAGEELDRQLEQATSGLLMQMIDNKILLHRAGRILDLEAFGDNTVQMFKEHQQIASDAELHKLLAQAGMTIDDLKEQLVNSYAPDQIIRMEVGNRVAVGDKEVASYYESHAEEFQVEAEVTVREIVLLTEAKNPDEVRAEAEKVRDRAVSEDADFAALAKEYSQAGTAAEGGLLGPLKKGELSAALEEVAFSTPVGEVGPLLETPYGFHLVKVEERTETTIMPLDEVQEELHGRLEDKKFREALDAFLKRARDEADWKVNEKYQHRLPGGDPS